MNSYFVETGTSFGDCINLALDLGFEKIFSIELDDKLQEQNIKKYDSLINKGQVKLFIGDSTLELSKVISLLDKPTTFWLDAHQDFGPKGVKRCPLYEELSSIKLSNIKTHTILIDDIRIFGHWWGEEIDLDTLKSKILDINPEYKFKYEDGVISNDILVAYI